MLPADDIELTSERGVSVPRGLIGVDAYTGPVVVNYATPPDYVPEASATTTTVVIQAGEWELMLAEERIRRVIRQATDLTPAHSKDFIEQRRFDQRSSFWRWLAR